MASTKLNRQEYALVPGLGTQQDITKFITIVNQGEMAYATDTNEFFIFNGTQWQKIPFVLVADSATPDMGNIQTSSRIGLSTDYITDKAIAHCKIGSNDNLTEGSIRYDQPNFQIYRNGAWINITVDVATRLDEVYGYVVEYIPAGYTKYYELMSGNSSSIITLSGLPMVQGYKASMGAYSLPQVVDGGTF